LLGITALRLLRLALEVFSSRNLSPLTLIFWLSLVAVVVALVGMVAVAVPEVTEHLRALAEAIPVRSRIYR
jgi:hypothetical protein